MRSKRRMTYAALGLEQGEETIADTRVALRLPIVMRALFHLHNVRA